MLRHLFPLLPSIDIQPRVAYLARVQRAIDRHHRCGGFGFPVWPAPGIVVEAPPVLPGPGDGDAGVVLPGAAFTGVPGELVTGAGGGTAEGGG
jgi:hypothetical protein